MIYDKPQFERIYKDNYRQMYRIAYSMTEDEEEARDAVSQVFASMWQSRPDVDESAVTGYLLTAVRNQCLHILERRARQEQLREELGREQRQPQDASRRELLSELHRIISENLTEQDRRVLVLHFDEEKTYNETAQALGISTSAVNKHITQSLAKIRKILRIRKSEK